MTKISLELDPTLHQRLKRYALDVYGNDHGRQQGVIREALISFLDAQEAKHIPKPTPTQTEVTGQITEECKPEGNTEVCEVPPRKLSTDLATQERIKEIWRTNPELSYTKIGEQVGYSKDVVYRFVKKLIAQGELIKTSL